MSKQSGKTQPPPDGRILDLYPQMPEPRELGIDAIRRSGGPHRVLEELVDRLERQADRLEEARDSSCVFARVLGRMNHRLADSLLRSGWDDPEWVALLALRTADHYMQALRARHAGQPSSSVWSSLFEAAHKRQTSVSEELVLALSAHFVHDLPQALAEVGMRDKSGETRLRDYHAVNDPLGLAVEDIALELTRRYESWFAPADHIDVGLARILSNEGVRVARATAWYNTERLLHAQLKTSAQSAIRRWPLVTLYELLHPPVWSTRFASRRVRVLSRWARSWPGRRIGVR
jgi:hypothetical protein